MLSPNTRFRTPPNLGPSRRPQSAAARSPATFHREVQPGKAVEFRPLHSVGHRQELPSRPAQGWHADQRPGWKSDTPVWERCIPPYQACVDPHLRRKREEGMRVKVRERQLERQVSNHRRYITELRRQLAHAQGYDPDSQAGVPYASAAYVADIELQNEMLRMRLAPKDELAAAAVEAAAKAAVAAVQDGVTDPEEDEGEGENEMHASVATWSLGGWTHSLSLGEVVADVLMRQVHNHTAAIQAQGRRSSADRSFVAHVGKLATRGAVLKLLEEGLLLEQLADRVFSAAQALGMEEEGRGMAGGVCHGSAGIGVAQMSAGRGGAHSAEKLNAKFMEDGAITLAYGDASVYFGGLRALVGPPLPEGEVAGVVTEHCNAADSSTDFCGGNYGVVTSSKVEYNFVVDPTERSLQR